MAVKHLISVLNQMGLPTEKKFFDGSPEIVIEHSGLVVIPFWIISHGLNKGTISVDDSVDVPLRNYNIITAFLQDYHDTPEAQWFSGMACGVEPYAFILDTKNWDNSGLYYLKEGQKKVRLRTLSTKKPNGYLITIGGDLDSYPPQSNEVDGANFVGTNYLLKRTPFRLDNQYGWTPNTSSGTKRFSVDFINSLLK